MWQNLCADLAEKKLLLWGMGKEGTSTYRFLRRHFPVKPLVIADAQIETLRADPKLSADRYVTFWTQEQAIAKLGSFDRVLKSPGIPTATLALGKNAARITGQADLFLKFAPGKVVGITGTKGKSTTSALLTQLLKTTTNDVWLGGNFGVPLWDFIERLGPNSITVAELSSYQLETVQHPPTIAIWLNLFQEHLNYHGSFAAYQEAKAHLVRFLKPKNHLIYGADDPGVQAALALEGKIPAQLHPIDAETPFPFSLKGNRNLRGRHNRFNALCALTAARLLGIPDQVMQKAFDSFASLPHRLEDLGVIGNARYFNDSISTVPEATLAALEAIPEADILIVGGMNRGISYQKLADGLAQNKRLRLLILLPETGLVLRELLKEKEKNGKKFSFRIQSVEGLPEAVRLACTGIRAGDVCLFSPAASSYNCYKNYEERGEAFRNLVNRFAQKKSPPKRGLVEETS